MNVKTPEQLFYAAVTELARQAQSALVAAAATSSDEVRGRQLDTGSLRIRDISDAL